MEKLKNLSLKRTIILYMGIAILISTPLSLLVNNAAENTQHNIWIKYISEEEFDLIREHGDMTSIPRTPSSLMTDKEIFIGITNFGASSIDYTIRVWVKNSDYWKAYLPMLVTPSAITADFTRLLLPCHGALE